MSIVLSIVGVVVVVIIVLTILATVIAVIGAFFAWRVIAPHARQFRMHIDKFGIRAFTEHGEIIPGSVTYKSKHEEKPKRYLTVGDDGELVDVYDEDESSFSSNG